MQVFASGSSNNTHQTSQSLILGVELWFQCENYPDNLQSWDFQGGGASEVVAHVSSYAEETSIYKLQHL